MHEEPAWAGHCTTGVPSLRGEDREEFLQNCDAWYRSDRGQHVPCKVIEPSCQGGQSALVRFWCKEKAVPQGRLTQKAAAAGGRGIGGRPILGAGRAIPGTPISGTKARRKEAQCDQQAQPEQEEEATGGCGSGGRPILGVGCAISGTPILGTEELQVTTADQEDKAAWGCGAAGRPMLGVGRAISGTSILGTPGCAISGTAMSGTEEPQNTTADQEDKAAWGCGAAGCPILGVGCAISGTSILGTEEPQTTTADQEDKAAWGCGAAGRPMLGVGRAISGTSILGTPGCAISGTAILGTEEPQKDASKAQYNAAQLDRLEAERWQLLSRKQQEGAIAAMHEGRGQQIRRIIAARRAMEARALQALERASIEAAAEALGVAREAELLEKEEKEKGRRDWEAAAIKRIQTKWRRVGSAEGGARAWHKQVVTRIKAHHRTAEAWSRMARAARAKSRSIRFATAGSDRQHRQDQLRKQQQLKLKQDKARRQQLQEASHAERREAANAEIGAGEEAWALALEGECKPEVEERAGKVETRRLAKHKAKREGGVALWKKAEKDAARKTAKQLQARVRQLASETAAIFEFEVGQAAEIADGKSRYRLNRVFSTKQLESPEETIKRYWRRAAEQPQTGEFIKGETIGIDRALEKLRANVRYRMERQPETIETSWQELRAVLQDRIQSLVSAMEIGEVGAVKEMLGDVMYTMCAARDDDSDKAKAWQH